jgi:hypothetical protein
MKSSCLREGRKERKSEICWLNSFLEVRGKVLLDCAKNCWKKSIQQVTEPRKLISLSATRFKQNCESLSWFSGLEMSISSS